MKFKLNKIALTTILIGLTPLVWAQSVGSEQHGHGRVGMTHAASTATGSDPAMDGMDHGSMGEAQGGTPPDDARDPHGYSGGYSLGVGKYALSETRQLKLADEHNFGSLLANRFERVNSSYGNSFAYEAQARFGRDYDRLVIKAEGDLAEGKVPQARTEALWGHAFAPFWDTQLGFPCEPC